MNQQELETLLNEYAGAVKARATLDIELAAALDTILTPAQKAYIEATQLEFDKRSHAADATVEELQDRIRAGALESKISAMGLEYEIVYSDGRTTWNTKKLDEAVKLIPGLAEYRNQGDPYTTLRKAKAAK